jgi:TonB family protein
MAMTRWIAVLIVVGVGLGCGHGGKRPDEGIDQGGHQSGWRPGMGPRDDAKSGMKVDYELGVLDTGDVEEAIGRRIEQMKSCYRMAGKAQRYAGGRVLLRFLVGATGKPDDVLVAESNLGNYGVERCLVHVGRAIAFKAPVGGKATTFDYPIEFRAAAEEKVLNLDGLKVEHDLSVRMHTLADCGRLANEPVAAIFYIEPNGLVGSVGLAGGVPFDEDTGDCMVQTIQTWRMSATLPGHFLRCNFRIPPVIASAEPPLIKSPPLPPRRRRH